MKKLLFAAAVITAMASCSNNEIIDVNPGEGISFRTSLDKATRANAENVTTLENLNDFKVTGLTNNQNYFTDLLVSKAGSVWNTESTYYWPNDNVQFFAYAPTNIGTGTISINNSGQQITNFTPETEVANQKDLLISYNTGNKTTNESTGVLMNFKHALSQIEIKAKCSNPNIKIEVKGVRIVNAGRKADFTFPTEVTNSTYTLPQAKWSNLQDKDTKEAYKVKGENIVELTSSAQSIMFGQKNFMLIPQQLTAWAGKGHTTGAYISVLCRIYSKSGSEEILLYPKTSPATRASVILPEQTMYAYASVAIDTNWEPGKKYIYTLDFCSSTNSGGAGLIDPNPDNTTDPEVDPNPKDGSEGGDPVLNGPIKFTVTVDNWVDETKDIIMN